MNPNITKLTVNCANAKLDTRNHKFDVEMGRIHHVWHHSWIKNEKLTQETREHGIHSGKLVETTCVCVCFLKN